jgi:hypothetical protein
MVNTWRRTGGHEGNAMEIATVVFTRDLRLHDSFFT